MKDSSYTPVENDFRQYIEMRFAPGQTEAQIRLFRDLFFAGANSLKTIIEDHPAMKDIAFEELADSGTERERRDPCG